MHSHLFLTEVIGLYIIVLSEEHFEQLSIHSIVRHNTLNSTLFKVERRPMFFNNPQIVLLIQLSGLDLTVILTMLMSQTALLL